MEGSLFPLSDGLMIEQVNWKEQQVFISARSAASLARCPLCNTPSEAIHSHYLRTVADLPEAGHLVILKLIVRRFFCRHALCARRIFTERLPDLVQPWAQMTNRLREALRVLSFATCAEAGSRLAPHLGMKGSPSTLLRCQKVALLAPPESFTKIGLDDFAFRRGRTYGTIIVNLETCKFGNSVSANFDKSVSDPPSHLEERPTHRFILIPSIEFPNLHVAVILRGKKSKLGEVLCLGRR